MFLKSFKKRLSASCSCSRVICADRPNLLLFRFLFVEIFLQTKPSVLWICITLCWAMTLLPWQNASIDRSAPILPKLPSNYSWYVEFGLVPRNENVIVDLKRNLFRQKRSWPSLSSFMQWITWLLAVKLQQCSTWLQNLLTPRSLQGLSSLFLVILVCTVSS